MKTIAIIKTVTEDGEVISPAEPFPADAIDIRCDGKQYTVYQTGDKLP